MVNWIFTDSNGAQAKNHLVRKRTLNHSVKGILYDQTDIVQTFMIILLLAFYISLFTIYSTKKNLA